MISVVIATFKRPKKLSRLLFSIINQKVLPNEIIIIDDCSDMDLEYKRIINDGRKIYKNIRYFKNMKNLGAPKSRNIGILKSSSEWIALTDDDDIWLPNKLELQKKQLSFLSEKVGIILSWAYIEKQNKRKFYNFQPKQYNPIKNILESNFITSPTPLVRKDAFIKAGLFDEKLISCQDWDMWVRIFLLKYDYIIIKEPLVVYFADNSDSIGQSKMAKIGYRQFIVKHFLLILTKTNPFNWFKKLITFIRTL